MNLGRAGVGAILVAGMIGCEANGLLLVQRTPSPPVSTLAPLQTAIPTYSALMTSPPATDDDSTHHSVAHFQVFILNPVIACIAGDDFYSGDVCYGEDCGDCNCTWEEFDPPAPLLGVFPAQLQDTPYADYEHRLCFEITLTDGEVTDIIGDMQLVRDKVFEWSEGALELEMEFNILSHVHTGFVAPDFVFGPFEVDDELLNAYVTTETDFVYVVSGVYDRSRGAHLGYACGGAYGEMSIHGAGYANIQYNDLCHSVTIAGRDVYEPLIHEWMHNLDWALYNIVQVDDIYQFAWPDWERWQAGTMPRCGEGNPDAQMWFPSVDLCEWDPDWMDCNNVASAGLCAHAGEVDGMPSWYEHVIREHYPRWIDFEGNHCRDGRKDFGESAIDMGGPCP
jgi:hypothetical protein